MLILTQDAASCDLLSRRKAGHLASKIKRHFFNHKHQPQGRFNLLVDRQKLSHPSGVPFIFRYYLDAALMFARALRLDAKIKPQLDECGLAIQGWWRDLDGSGSGSDVGSEAWNSSSPRRSRSSRRRMAWESDGK